MRCPKSRFPIQIIVFDELELIIFVSQGLTLSTASLVVTNNSTKHRREYKAKLDKLGFGGTMVKDLSIQIQK